MNYSSKEYLGDRPYENYEEYLDDLMMYIILCLRGHIINTYGIPNDDILNNDQQLPGYREVLYHLEMALHKKDIDDDQDIRDWYENILGRKEVSESMGIIYPIDDIIYRADLDDFAVVLLSISLLSALDKTYQRVYQFIYRDLDMKHPTLELCAKLYYKTSFTRYKMKLLINEHASKLLILFPELAKSDNLMFGELVCDERLTDIILGRERFYTTGVTIAEYNADIDPLLYREEELKRLSGFSDETEYPLFLICGDRGAGKRHLIRHFSVKNRTATVFLDIKGNPVSDRMDMSPVMSEVRYAARECMIKTLPLAITGLEFLNESELEQLSDFIKNSIKNTVRTIFLCLSKGHYTSGIEGLYVIELKDLTELQRIVLWRYYSRDYILEDGLDLSQIANTFLITPGQIIGAIKQAALLSGGRSRPIPEKLLYQACYAQLDHKLSEKTSKVKTNYTWDDLKMPASDKETLRDVCNCVKNRHIVMNEWNFSEIIPYGSGLTVLFSGPPGTGKTMAAQVIANELRMELYKIDVSQVFDKYVGETEKNIKQIFDQAKKSNSILFFDEADAIFNKRLEASSSNDRFANIESSLLLQCVEEYSGISILATNNFNAIDTAFIRRFKYYVLFREPDEHVRYEIWKSVIPKEAPLSNDVDLKLLAKQFEFTGAVIKNVIISSAYLAAERREAISMVDILLSIKREMFKNNLILTKEKLGSLGYLFDDIK